MKQNYKMHTERVKKSIDHEKGSDNTAATTKMPNDRSFSQLSEIIRGNLSNNVNKAIN